MTVSVPPSMALKAAVYLAVREAGISNSEFARRMKRDEKEARRILDPHPQPSSHVSERRCRFSGVTSSYLSRKLHGGVTGRGSGNYVLSRATTRSVTI